MSSLFLSQQHNNSNVSLAGVASSVTREWTDLGHIFLCLLVVDELNKVQSNVECMPFWTLRDTLYFTILHVNQFKKVQLDTCPNRSELASLREQHNKNKVWQGRGLDLFNPTLLSPRNDVALNRRRRPHLNYPNPITPVRSPSDTNTTVDPHGSHLIITDCHDYKCNRSVIIAYPGQQKPAIYFLSKSNKRTYSFLLPPPSPFSSAALSSLSL
ncbi:hypothetical protein RIF29_40813 [Crotalaria pallida]|uniref:Uncharacterized protein n=1 Tax=Crotalaria pallida TaxID=3830 RepID=A0AAN9E3W7_CROPI